MHTSGSPRSAHSCCTCSHRSPFGSHATATCVNPFTLAAATAQSSASPSRNAFTFTVFTGQHPQVMINHRQRLLVLRQVDPDHRAITR
jgi:hypothetical protein